MEVRKINGLASGTGLIKNQLSGFVFSNLDYLEV